MDPTLRRRLERWRLPTLSRALVPRAIQRIQSTFRLCQPRVGATLLTTWLNGWTTSRRMRGCSPTFSCRICGQPSAEESIEHFAFCPKVQLLATQVFNLPRAIEAPSAAHHLQEYLCLGDECPDDALRRRALLLQVTKYLFDICKYAARPSSDLQWVDMGRLLLYRATRGQAVDASQAWATGQPLPSALTARRGRGRHPPRAGAEAPAQRRRGAGS